MIRDQETRTRIVTDAATSFCVEASAGTGKTRLMVERVLHQVLDQGMELSRMVAITFTERAAGELRQRIREGLEGARRQCLRADRPLEVVDRALADLELAPISTIHAFAASLLRERPVEAGVDPGFTLADELGIGLLLDRAWEQWRGRVLDEAPAALRHALLAGLEIKDVEAVFREMYWKREHAAALPAPDPPLESLVDRLDALMAEGAACLESCVRPAQDTGAQQWERLQEDYRRAAPLDPGSLVRLLPEWKVNTRGGRQENWTGGSLERMRGVLKALKDLQGNLTASVLAHLLYLVRGGLAVVEQEKDRRDALDFDDLLLRARDLLRGDLRTRRYFQDRYDRIVIDEFQDTDPLQVEIAFFLCEDGARAARWQDVVLRPGKLCIVGDPKQSIYRFRRADIEVYMAAQEKIRAQGSVMPIQVNFRCAPPVAAWVNSLFADLIVPEENFQPAYQELLPWREADPSSPVGVTFLHPAAPAADVRQARRHEAAALVAAMRRIRREEWPVGGERPPGGPRWGDMAVLLPALTQSFLYEDALRAAGIPYRLDGGKQYFARQEIHALVACLQAIDDPGDEIALAAALRSLFFGFSDEELLRLRLAAGRLSFFTGTERIEGSGVPGLAAALALLRALHQERNRVSLAFTLRRLFGATHAWEKHLLTFGGRHAVSNLQKALRHARGFEKAGGATFRRFVRWLRRLESDDQQEAESTLVETGEDAVQLLTIHKAKGLEFPIVFLANMSTAPAARHGGPLLHREHGTLQWRISAGGRTFATPDHNKAAVLEERREVAERRRLLYVAATRARDHLLISLFRSGGGRRAGTRGGDPPQGGEPAAAGHASPSRVLLSYVLPRADPFGGSGGGAERHDGPGGEVVQGNVRHWRVPDPGLPADPEFTHAFPVKAEAAPTWEERLQNWGQDRSVLLARASVSWAPSAASGREERVPASFAALPGSRAVDASRVGSAFHRVVYRVAAPDLPRLAAEAGRRPPYLRDLVEQTAQEFGLRDAEELLGLVTRPLPPALAELLSAARALWREVPFVAHLEHAPPAQGRKFPSLWEGVIDLLAETADGTLAVIDYKTDRVSPAEAAARMEQYRPQARIYRAAVEQMSGQPVAGVWFYFVRAGILLGQPPG